MDDSKDQENLQDKGNSSIVLNLLSKKCDPNSEPEICDLNLDPEKDPSFEKNSSKELVDCQSFSSENDLNIAIPSKILEGTNSKDQINTSVANLEKDLVKDENCGTMSKTCNSQDKLDSCISTDGINIETLNEEVSVDDSSRLVKISENNVIQEQLTMVSDEAKSNLEDLIEDERCSTVCTTISETVTSQDKLDTCNSTDEIKIDTLNEEVSVDDSSRLLKVSENNVIQEQLTMVSDEAKGNLEDLVEDESCGTLSETGTSQDKLDTYNSTDGISIETLNEEVSVDDSSRLLKASENNVIQEQLTMVTDEANGNLEDLVEDESCGTMSETGTSQDKLDTCNSTDEIKIDTLNEEVSVDDSSRLLKASENNVIQEQLTMVTDEAKGNLEDLVEDESCGTMSETGTSQDKLDTCNSTDEIKIDTLNEEVSVDDNSRLIKISENNVILEQITKVNDEAKSNLEDLVEDESCGTMSETGNSQDKLDSFNSTDGINIESLNKCIIVDDIRLLGGSEKDIVSEKMNLESEEAKSNSKAANEPNIEVSVNKNMHLEYTEVQNLTTDLNSESNVVKELENLISSYGDKKEFEILEYENKKMPHESKVAFISDNVHILESCNLELKNALMKSKSLDSIDVKEKEVNVNKLICKKLGEDIKDGLFKRIVIVGDNFAASIVDFWPVDSNIQPYFFCSNSLSTTKIFEAMKESHVFRDCDKVLMVVIPNVTDIILYKDFIIKSCNHEHPNFQMPSSAIEIKDVKEYIARLKCEKTHFEYCHSHVTVIFSFFPLLNWPKDMYTIFNNQSSSGLSKSSIYSEPTQQKGKKFILQRRKNSRTKSMEKRRLNKQLKYGVVNQGASTSSQATTVEHRSLECKYETFQRKIKYPNNYRKFVKYLNQYLFANWTNLSWNKCYRYFNFTPHCVNFRDNKWAATSKRGKIINAFDLNRSLHLFLFGTNSKCQPVNLTLYPKPELKVYVIGDDWLKAICNKWPFHSSIHPFFCCDSSLNLEQLEERIISLTKKDDKCLVIICLGTNNFTCYKEEPECLDHDHDPMKYLEPLEQLTKDPHRFSEELFKKVSILKNSIYKRRVNCKLVFSSCFPISFNKINEFLSEVHEYKTKHSIEPKTYYNANSNLVNGVMRSLNSKLVTLNCDSHSVVFWDVFGICFTYMKQYTIPFYRPHTVPTDVAILNLMKNVKGSLESIEKNLPNDLLPFKSHSYDRNFDELCAAKEAVKQLAILSKNPKSHSHEKILKSVSCTKSPNQAKRPSTSKKTKFDRKSSKLKTKACSTVCKSSFYSTKFSREKMLEDCQITEKANAPLNFPPVSYYSQISTSDTSPYNTMTISNELELQYQKKERSYTKTEFETLRSHTKTAPKFILLKSKGHSIFRGHPLGSRNLWHSRSRDLQRSRSRDLQRSRSRDLRRSRYRDLRRSRSRDLRRSRSRDLRRSRSRDLRCSRSRDLRHSRSRDLRHSRSRDLRRSRSRDLRRSRSRDLRHSRSRDLRRSRSRNLRRSRSRNLRHLRNLQRSRSRDLQRSSSKSEERKSKKRKKQTSSNSGDDSDAFRKKSLKLSKHDDKLSSTKKLALESLWKFHCTECDTYRKYPSAHPAYQHFQSMWQYAILEPSSNFSPHQLQDKWSHFWTEKMEKLFEESWHEKKQKCLKLVDPDPFKSESSPNSKLSKKQTQNKSLPAEHKEKQSSIEDGMQISVIKNAKSMEIASSTPTSMKEPHFSVEEVTSVLSEMSDKFGALGVSVRLLHKSVMSSITNGDDPLKCLDEDAKMLLSLIEGKIIKAVNSKSSSVQQNAFLQKALDRLSLFLKSLKKDVVNHKVDVDIIAKATMGQEVMDIVNFIKNALAYKQITDVTNNDIMQIYLAVKEKQLTITSTSHVAGPSLSQPFCQAQQMSKYVELEKKFKTLPLTDKIKKFTNFNHLPLEEKKFLLAHLDDLKKNDIKLAVSFTRLMSND